jgi:hypothetical protein
LFSFSDAARGAHCLSMISLSKFMERPMAKFVKVTHVDGLSGFINADLVTEVRKITTEDSFCRIYFAGNGEGVPVEGSSVEIARQLEAR